MLLLHRNQLSVVSQLDGRKLIGEPGLFLCRRPQRLVVGFALLYYCGLQRDEILAERALPRPALKLRDPGVFGSERFLLLKAPLSQLKHLHRAKCLGQTAGG